MDLVTRSHAALLAELLFDWQTLVLREPARTAFLRWLRDHTGMEVFLDTFKTNVTEWLLHCETPKRMFAEVLLIQAEILWFASRPDH